ncbi:MAG: ATP-binding protein [Oscillospiraceae bacterium]|nr:ATP-binding protein [Oscillospiraceae bacterium]
MKILKAKCLFNAAKSQRVLYMQILYVFLAFALMVYASYRFTYEVESRHLDREMEDTFSSVEIKLVSNLKELETMLGVVAQTARSMILQGAGTDEVKAYMTDMSDYGVGAGQVAGFAGFIAGFGEDGMDSFNSLVTGEQWDALIASGFNPAERPWHIAAQTSGDKIAVTDPYVDVVSKQATFSYVQNIYDDSGKRLAIIGVDVLLDRIYRFSQDNRGSEINTWTLTDKNHVVIAHPNADFVGVPFGEIESGFAAYSGELEREGSINRRSALDYRGRASIFSARPMENGWILGVVYFTDSYYNNLSSTMWFLIALGSLLAASLSAVLVHLNIKRSRAEALTRLSEERMQKAVEEANTLASLGVILNGLDVMVYVTDPATDEILFINDSLKQHFGLEGDCIGVPCYKLLQKDKDARCSFCPCYGLEENPDKEYAWEEKNTATGRVYHNVDRYIDWPGGKKVHMQSRIDITQTRQIQENLADNNLRLNLLVKGLNVGLWDRLIDNARTYDDGDTDLWWSDEFRRLLGFTDENDFPNKASSWLNRIHPDDIGPTIDAMNAFLEDKTGNTPYNVINRIQNKNGEYRWYRSFGSALRDSEGNPLRTAGATEDITAFKEAEREIAEKSELNRIMFNNAPVGLTVFDESFRFIDCNEKVLQIYGLSREQYAEFFGSAGHSPELQPDGQSSAEKAMDVIKRVMDGETMRIEWTHMLPDGTFLPTELTMVRTMSGGRYVGLGYIYDMREQQRLRSEIRDALDKAETASRAKSAFLANMSHEIRTPMNAILGITELELQKETLSPDTEEALGRMYESGDLLLNIINDILDLSKIEAGKLEIAPVKYDMPSLINDAVQLNRLRYESKPIDFKLEIDPFTPLNLIGDELRIKQVLNNILSNAYKYTAKGEVGLSVSHEAVQGGAPGDITLIFRVRDTGQGMSPEQVEKLFDEYTRFNMEANRTTVGTGLGMSISRRLLDLMGGEISVRSEAGSGSVFTVRLPQKRVNGLVCGGDLAQRLMSNRFQSTAMKKKGRMPREYMPYGNVLVVDDVESNAYVAMGMMMPYGLQVDTSISGYDAIEKVKSGKIYDIIFMDHMMPGMDGIEATGILRGMGYKHSIVALTANALVGQAEKFMQNGFDGFISKPIDSRELNIILNEFIRDKKPREVIEDARRKHRAERMKEAAAPARAENDFTGLYDLFLLDAENALAVMEGISAKPGGLSDTDMYNIEISAHGMKTALANIGEENLSRSAKGLERAAMEKDSALVHALIPGFIGELKELAQNPKPGKTEGPGYLRERLADLAAACNGRSLTEAKAIVGELMQKTWPDALGDVLDEINVHLLHGDLKKAAEIAAQIENRN